MKQARIIKIRLKKIKRLKIYLKIKEKVKPKEKKEKVSPKDKKEEIELKEKEVSEKIKDILEKVKPETNVIDIQSEEHEKLKEVKYDKRGRPIIEEPPKFRRLRVNKQNITLELIGTTKEKEEVKPEVKVTRRDKTPKEKEKIKTITKDKTPKEEKEDKITKRDKTSEKELKPDEEGKDKTLGFEIKQGTHFEIKGREKSETPDKRTRTQYDLE